MVIDQYILRQMLRWYAVIIAIVVGLLSLEMLPRLLARLDQSGDGGAVIARMMASLLPEYLAVALPVATFLATALTFRQLALHDEIDALAAAGISDWRMLRWPLIVGLCAALSLFAMRNTLEPAGERNLDAIGVAVANGDYGIGLEPGVPHRLAPGTTLYFETVEPRDRMIANVLIRRGTTTISARTARLARSARGGLSITFHQGVTLSPGDHGRPHVMRFATFDLVVPVPGHAAPHRQTIREQLDRYPLAALLATGEGSRMGPPPKAAIAALCGRVSAAALCLVLPLFSLPLAIPPKRARSSIGIGVGLILIILFWRLSALIEDAGTVHAPAASILLILNYAGLGCGLLVIERRCGAGTIEAACRHIASGIMVRSGRQATR